MFSVLDADSLRTLESKRTRDTRTVKPLKVKKFKAEHIIYGKSNRSRNGCLCCRKRKKKCDEVSPVCGSCHQRKVQCIWRHNENFNEKGSELELEILSAVEPQKSISPVNIVVSKSKGEESGDVDPWYQPTYIDYSNGCQELTTSDVRTNINSLEEQNTHENLIYSTEDLSANKVSYPLSGTFAITLDEQGSSYLKSFIDRVARVVCIGPESSNYFLSTFLKLAREEKPILYALCSWGGLFIEKDNLVSSHMGKALAMINHRYQHASHLNSFDLYILLNFFTICIGMQVCAGDVEHWYKFFTKCSNVINNNGGLRSICELFNYSNDIKWLVSNLQFHDIMSSVAFLEGTIFPLKDYDFIFNQNKILEVGNYGLDPLQGCIQPLYLILGEIQMASIRLKEKRELLEYHMNRSHDEIDYYEEVQEVYTSLKNSILNCHLSPSQILLLFHDTQELELHLLLFELYGYTCELCLNMQIKQLPPNSHELQSLLLNALIRIDILKSTKMVASLAMLLLICGVTCYTKSDRLLMKERFEDVFKRYKMGNLKRIWTIVQDVWREDLDGSKCINWAYICHKKGWILSLC
ncbi:uncharacterized protein PRCAT00003534001 [Priceomyces carsonii]|uniref:uncharacterized protein n=1 Tax=Priceomyces carsonii TaxID=28549 RepID=UPI002EDAE2AC|nr:unnamed protein product [Priceomyces carsonii]